MRADEIAEDIERMWVLFPAGDDRRERLRGLAAGIRALDGARADKLRLALFQMRDSREVAAKHGFVLKPEAKAKMYDLMQDIIRSAIAADDAAAAR